MLNFKSAIIGLVTSFFVVSGAFALDCKKDEFPNLSYSIENLQESPRLIGTSCWHYPEVTVSYNGHTAYFDSEQEMRTFVDFLKNFKKIGLTKEQLAAIIALNGLSPAKVAAVQKVLTADVAKKFGFVAKMKELHEPTSSPRTVRVYRVLGITTDNADWLD